MRRCSLFLFQSGVHIPHGARYNAARIKNWPSQKIPDNFTFTTEQKLRSKCIPRDTGKIPKDFVLSVLYRHQPCEISMLWNYCVSDPRIVLDSKKHLRDVLQQIRSEGFVVFEKNLSSQQWECHLTREKYEYVRNLVRSNSSPPFLHDNGNDLTNTLSDDDRKDQISDSKDVSSTASITDLQTDLVQLEQKLAETTQRLSQYQRVEADYLPYTDLNGKVNFMWWYETTDSAVASQPDDHSDMNRITT